MRIFKEVKVENAQQADALPSDTHYFFDNVGRSCDRFGGTWEWTEGEYSYAPFYPATALVAMEAEVEEKVVLSGAVNPFPAYYFSTEDDKVRDPAGNDITEGYRQWVKSLPVEKRIVTEWS